MADISKFRAGLTEYDAKDLTARQQLAALIGQDKGKSVRQIVSEVSGGPGTGGAGVVIVEVGYDASIDVATASHSASEIFTLVQGGASVVAVVNGKDRYPYKRATINIDGGVASVDFSFTEVGEQNDNVTTYGLTIDNYKDCTRWYTEFVGGGGVTPIFEIDEIETLEAGESAYVQIDNADPAHPRISFGIPAGENGAEIVRLDEMGGDATKTTYRFVLSNGSGYDFDVYHGKDGANAAGEETPSIVLTDKLYAVAGHEFVLYYRNILRAMRPEDFAVTTSFASGSTLPNLKPLYDGHLRFTPAETHVGSHTLTIKVFSRRTWEVVATKSVTLVISSDKAISGKKVMYIGDSLTYASVYPAEIQNMSTDGIMSVGIISHSISFNGGTAAIKSEGRNSAASYDYVNDQTFAGYDNPFYNPDTEHLLTLDGKYTTGLLNLDNTGSVSVLKHHFDFSYYMTNNGDTVGEPDAVFINLGTNGGNKSAYQAVFIAFDAMIERIKSYNADLPVFLHLFPPKSEAGSTDRTAGGTVSGWLNARTWYYDIIQTFIDRYENDSRVTLVPTYTMLDPVYDYKRETVAVSARNTETVTIGQTDGTHPANPGYLHMADSYYNILQALWSGEAIDTYYTVTNNLTNVINSNSATTVVEGASYSATLTAALGYTLDTVTVTMGGESVSVSGGAISISAVTGDIVITATAVEEEGEPTVVNLVDPSTANDASPNTALFADEWVNGYKLSSSSFNSNALVIGSGIITTDLVPVDINSKLRIEGMDISTAAKKNELRVVLFNADGTRTHNTYYTPTSSNDNDVVDQELITKGVVLVTIGNLTSATAYPNLTYARISCYPLNGDNSNVVVTVE